MVFNHEAFPEFKWKMVSYDPEGIRYVTYECTLCRTTIKEHDDQLVEALSKHQEVCASTTA